MADLLSLFQQQAPFDQLVGPLNQTFDPEVFEQLGAGLAEAEAEVRLYAARVLGDAGNPESLYTLAALLDDPEDEVRLEALRSIYRLGGDTTEEAALGALLLQDPCPPVREAAALALAVTRTPGARALLGQALEDPDPDVRTVVQQQIDRIS